MRKNKVVLIALGLCLTGAGGAVAQTSVPSTPPPAAPSTQAPPVAAPAPNQPSRTFRPSEDVSPGRKVSFPNDI